MPFATGLSVAADTEVAVREIVDQVQTSSAAQRYDLALVFFTPHHHGQARELISLLQQHLPAANLIGCIGESIVANEREIESDPGLAVWLGSWNDQVAVKVFHLHLEQTPDGPTLLGWPDALLEADPKRSLLLLLGDPFTFPTTELFLPRLREDYPGLAVVGGMASGVAAMGQTLLLHQNHLTNYGAVGVLLTGDLAVRSIVSQGCRPIGRPLIITKAEENIIHELSGQTPLAYLQSLYRELSDADKRLFENGPHLGVVMSEYRDKFERGDFLVRNLYGLDRQTGAMAVMDHLRVGQTVQFHVRDASTADEDLRTLLQQDRAKHGSAQAGLLFTCNGRGQRLFQTPNHDAGVIQAVAGPIPLAGFFAAGELGPVGGRNFLHGFTASVVLFG